MGRYERNIPAISEKEQSLLASKKVLVVGCGGLGGYITEHLIRLGVGEITAVDGDVFADSNLNRQLYSTAENLGTSKVEAAADRAKAVNPDVKLIPVNAFFGTDNADELVSGKDLVIDALDNVKTRYILEAACARNGVTIVHGAILGWNLQLTVVRPGNTILHELYYSEELDLDKSPENKMSLSPTVSTCASLEVAEALKLLLGRPSPLDGKLMLLDLLTMETRIIAL